VLQYNGVSWSFVSFPTSGEIKDVHIYSETLAIAGGTQGNVYIWDNTGAGGLRWRLRSDTGSQSWLAVQFVSPTEAWIAGTGGQVYRVDRVTTNGNIATSPSNIPGVTQTLEDIHMVSSTDGWIVGGSGTILRFSGGSWTLFADIGATPLYATTFLSIYDGWAVGSSGLIERMALLYKPTGVFVSRVIDGRDPAVVWVFAYWNQLLSSGSGVTIAVRTGNSSNVNDGSWSNYSAQYSNDISSTISPPTRRFIQYKLSFSRGINPWESPIVYDASIVRNSPINQAIQAVYINGPSDVWAVGGGGNILHYDGAIWSVFATVGANDLQDVVMRSSNNGWAAGQYGMFFHYDGSGWAVADDVGSATFNAISFIDDSHAFAVGNNGAIASYDGTAWNEIISPSAVNLNDVAMLPGNGWNAVGWAVGNSGLILRYDGSWSGSNSIDTGTETWHAISMLPGGGDGWIVGSGGAIRRWNGVSWVPVTSPTTATLYDVQMISATNGWAVGSNGTVIRWDGVSWTLVSAPLPTNIYTLHFLNGNLGWAGGASGNLAHFQGAGGVGSSSGFLVSSAFPLVGNSPVESIEWIENIPSACIGTCKVKFQIQTSVDGVSWFPAQWMGPEGDDGDETDYFTLATGNLIPNIVNGRQWVRYRVELAGDGVNTPTLQEVRIQYK
jgi:hypothetical protein